MREDGTDPRALPAAWRGRAGELRAYGAEAPARALERCADELDEQFRAHDTEALTIDGAARETGFTAGHLYRLINDGKLPNAGRKGSPRVRRCDLPRKGSLEAGDRDRAILEAVL